MYGQTYRCTNRETHRQKLEIKGAVTITKVLIYLRTANVNQFVSVYEISTHSTEAKRLIGNFFPA